MRESRLIFPCDLWKVRACHWLARTLGFSPSAKLLKRRGTVGNILNLFDSSLVEVNGASSRSNSSLKLSQQVISRTVRKTTEETQFLRILLSYRITASE